MNATRRALTPALEREARRLGALRSGMGSSASLTVGTAVSSSTSQLRAQFDAKLQAGLSSMSDAAKAQVLQTTGIDVNNLPAAGALNAQTVAGAAAVLSIAQNGFDPSNPADNAKLVHAISGGLALIVPIGTALAAFVEALWLVGNAIGCPITHLFGGTSPACGDPPCTSSGNWTPATILGASTLPAHPTGSFADLVLGMLAVNGANANNCKGAVTPDHVVDAAVNMWNETHEATGSIGVFVPPLSATNAPIIASGGLTVADFQLGVYSRDILSSAFQPIGQAPAGIQRWATLGIEWQAPALGLKATPPRVVQINAGPLAVQPSHVVALRVGATSADLTRLASTIQSFKSKGIPLAQWQAMPPATQAAWRAQGFAPASSPGMSAAKVAAGGLAVATVAWLAVNRWKWVRPTRATIRAAERRLKRYRFS
jgi:hypothetical protein